MSEGAENYSGAVGALTGSAKGPVRKGVLNVRLLAPSLIAEAKYEAWHAHQTLKEFVAAALEREVQWRREKRERPNTQGQRSS